MTTPAADKTAEDQCGQNGQGKKDEARVDGPALKEYRLASSEEAPEKRSASILDLGLFDSYARFSQTLVRAKAQPI